MVRTEERNWERSFQTKPRLSPAEAHALVSLQTRVTELRYLSLEYLLRRATASGTKSEKVAWESVWALVVFVEHQRRFPRQGELYPYLHKVLDESKTLEGLQLPDIDFSKSSPGAPEAQRSVLEQLISENSDYKSRVQRALQVLRPWLKIAKDELLSESPSKVTMREEVLAEAKLLQQLETFLDP